jgi:hypothetical protein
LNGFRVFDPETRRYFTTANVYIYEDFSSRIDALRHHDQRRALLKQKAEQPIVMDDFADSNSTAVRNLFLDPDAPMPAAPSVEAPLPPGLANRGDDVGVDDIRGAAALPELKTGLRRGAASVAPPRSPLLTGLLDQAAKNWHEAYSEQKSATIYLLRYLENRFSIHHIPLFLQAVP